MRFPDSTVVRSASLAGALLLTAGALTACGASTDEPAASSGSSSSASDLVATVKNGASQVTISMTSAGGGSCTLSATSAKAGPVTFSVTNKSASALTEIELQSDDRILGEKENLAPGLPTVKFTSTLGGGTYQVYCPGAAKEMQTFTVTGKATTETTGDTTTVLDAGTKGYAKYVDSVVADMQTAVGTLNTAVQAGNLAEAKRDYALARPFYERIESDVDGFVMPGFKATDNAGNLDYLIDMRASNLDQKVGWSGLHALERDLFLRGKITSKTKTYSANLVKNVGLLDGVVGSLDYKPEDLANGAAGLLEEVQSNKISGEEELYSHIDLVDFAANVEGAQQAFAYLQPGLEKIDPTLTANVTAQFAAVNKLLDTYRDKSIPGGFRYYDASLKAQAGAGLSRAVQALQEPLSQIAEKVATAQ